MSSGYRKPPPEHRFVKGRSGNPNGRPRKAKSQAPYEAVLGQKVTVRENGREQRLTASEAFLLHMTRKGLEGDGHAARLTMSAIHDARTRHARSGQAGPMSVTWVIVSPGSLASEMCSLKMARKLDPYRPSAKLKIEPWLVQAALERLGSRQLSVEEQVEVYGATRTPWKVNWPEWWLVRQ